MPWSTHIFFGLRPVSCVIIWNTLVTLAPFLCFNGTAYAYLLQATITYNNNQIPYCISLLTAGLKVRCTKCYLDKINTLYTSDIYSWSACKSLAKCWWPVWELVTLAIFALVPFPKFHWSYMTDDVVLRPGKSFLENLLYYIPFKRFLKFNHMAHWNLFGVVNSAILKFPAVVFSF